MPKQIAVRRARKDLREGKSPSTAAGEFVRIEMRQLGKGKRAPRSPQQAIAIGLSEARRAGIPLPPAPVKARAKKASKRASAAGTAKRARG
jgi:hypothetical protein